MLPPSLLDLLCHRLSASANAISPQIHSRVCVRGIQQLATQPAAPISHGAELHALRGLSEHVTRSSYSIRVRQAQKQVEAVSELEERVAALKDVVPLLKNDNGIFHEGPHFREAELRDIYKDLLSFPETDIKAPEQRSHPNVMEGLPSKLLQVLEERLLTFETAVDSKAGGTALSSKLHARMSRSSPLVEASLAHPIEHGLLQEDGSSLRRLINRLRVVLDKLQADRPHTATDGIPPSVLPVPLGLLSNTEWGTLSEICLDVDDAQASERVLDLMKLSGLSPSDEQYDAVLNWYATRGLVEETDALFSRLEIDIARDRQRDLLIKARVKAKRLDDACALVHSFETRTTPAPIQSYTRVIQALFAQRGPGSEQQKAQAWDMFSHMRYVAHATADHFLYTVMMRACAQSTDPEPERALDLFTEMTIDQKIAPTTVTYNAIILTCARSKKFALEAFRLAREMLNSHRDAYGETPAHLQPDSDTFCALLEAAKRLGDLPRARLVFAQMTSSARDTRGSDKPIYVNERAIMHVFHAYASYRPPFHREAVAFAPGKETDTGSHNKPPLNEASSPSPTREVKMATASPHRGPPQSHQEVVKEASNLWERILEHRQNTMEHQGKDPSTNYFVFDRVVLTTPLLNAYMAVHYVHSPPSAAYEVYANLFEPLGVPRDAYTYVGALEAYAQGKRASEPELRIAMSVARNIWKQWRDLEDAGVSQLSAKNTDSAVDARVVERAWTAMMRLLTLNGHVNEAISLLHQFVERYPPNLVKQPSPRDPKRSTRTSLYAERPIVRLTENTMVPEDRISPFLTFMDLNLLHQRAVAMKRNDHIAYITWVTKAYEGALRRRRDATLR